MKENTLVSKRGFRRCDEVIVQNKEERVDMRNQDRRRIYIDPPGIVNDKGK